MPLLPKTLGLAFVRPADGCRLQSRARAGRRSALPPGSALRSSPIQESSRTDFRRFVYDVDAGRHPDDRHAL